MRSTIALVLSLLAFGCSDSCSSTLLARHIDPASGLVAYVFVRDCGATTGYATNIAIGRLGEPQSEAQVAFTADDDHGAAQTEGRALWLRAAWTAPGKLSIAYAEHSRVFRKDASVVGAEIHYRESGPPNLPPVP